MHFGSFSLLKRIEQAKLTFFVPPKVLSLVKFLLITGWQGSDQFMSPLLLHIRWGMSDGIFIFTFLTSIQLYSHPTPMTSPFLASLFFVSRSLFLHRGISTYHWPTCPVAPQIFSRSFIFCAFFLLHSGSPRVLEPIPAVCGQRHSYTLGKLAVYRRAA